MEGRNILDAILIASEAVREWNAKKKRGFLLKLDYEKAYNVVDWSLLAVVLEKKGFGVKWHRWIQGCTVSADFSIFINGRPKGKFSAQRGLKQGCPLSSFLFT